MLLPSSIIMNIPMKSLMPQQVGQARRNNSTIKRRSNPADVLLSKSYNLFCPLARARMSVNSNSMDMLTTMKALLNCGENNFAKLQSKVIDGEADRKMCPSILPVLKRLLFPHSPLQTALPQLLYIIIFPYLSQSTHQAI